MSVEYFDGFDWAGLSGNTVAQDLLGRGWIPSTGLTVQALAATAMWSATQFRPIGRMLGLSGSGYLSHAVKPWIDTAVGMNLRLTSIPSGGPHKLIEVCTWSAGAMVPRYTVAILNGRLALYAYGEVGVDAVYEGATWFLGSLSANTTYSIHFYARRSQRILYVNGVQELLRGGYAGLEEFHAVRIYAPAALYLDDFYQTFTQPSIWPGAYDTFFPYADYDEDTGVSTPHRILTPSPIAELDMTGSWEVIEGGSLVNALDASDSTYIQKNVREPGDFEVDLEDVAFPSNLLAYQYQGLCRCNRQGSLNSPGYYFEARIPGIELVVDSPYMNVAQALEQYWHPDTVAIGNGDIKPSARDFRTEVNHARAFPHNYGVTSTVEYINEIQWGLRDLFQPSVYALGF